MPRLLAALLFSFAFALSAGCGDSYDNDPAAPTAETITGGQPMLRTIEVQLDGGSPLTVEVADDPEERTFGLSGRSGLAENTGMLFVWERAEPHTLWMKDMLFALDFVWLDDDRIVVSIDANVPIQPGVPDSELVQYHPTTPAKYAIELDAGEAEALGIEAGDTLVFDEDND